jgi:hypothetical protein
VNSATDAANCAACGTVCPVRANSTPVCSGSSCGFTCTGTYRDCNGTVADGCEIDTATSTANCSACGTVCPARANATTSCTGGACGFTCSGAYRDCNGSAADGCEANTLTSVNSCGGCGIVCPARAGATTTCSNGTCGYTCDANHLDCNGSAADGCEVYKWDDLNNCGTCANVCPARSNASRYCSSGSCGYTCNGNYGDCYSGAVDGCETYLVNNNSNCGSCGNACGGSATCSGTGCVSVVGTCNPFNSGSTYVWAYGWYWATIDCGSYNSTTAGCTTDYWRVPSGWYIAPDDWYTQTVIRAYYWNTHVGVTSNGNSYGTANYTQGFFSGNELASDGTGGYKVNGCSLRVMIRTGGD